ncbi:hypothetical protein OUZ56_006546 [Daphnia magna]|uniref:Uncharacterized protein n=1 Tax=Daphnia magna TaxID=35525 RepID=A0ABQ9YVZ6_9CRUS|nr:hypothetical protein OUZ56_006546 [Daphnia magna]
MFFLTLRPIVSCIYYADLIGFRSFREFLVFPGRNPIRETLEKTPQPSSIYHCQQNHFACTFLPRGKKIATERKQLALCDWTTDVTQNTDCPGLPIIFLL